LALLLRNCYRDRNSPVVYIGAWPLSDSETYAEVLVRMANKAGHEFVTTSNLEDTNIVFILDEGQVTYSDDDLWLGFVKRQVGRLWGPKICVFASYGSPTAGPADFAAGSPHAYLGPEQRVSVIKSTFPELPDISLFYSGGEFDDALGKLINNEIRPLPLTDAAKEYIWKLTNGQL
jgi:hypothetical protein